MIISAEQTLSKNQIINVGTGDVASQNVIDLGEPGKNTYAPAPGLRDIGKGRKFAIDMTIVGSPGTPGHVLVQLQVASNEDFASPNVLTSVDLNSASHPPYRFDGYRFNIPVPRRANARYLRVFYVHIAEEWMFNAMFVLAEQSNENEISVA